MNRILVYIALLIGYLGFSQENPVSIKTDTTSIRIGEQIQYKISVSEIDQVVFPELKMDSLKKVEVVESMTIDTLKNRLEKRYILTSFDSGNYVIPGQEIIIRNKKFLTDSLLINVIPVQVDTLKQGMYNIKSIKSEPKTFDDYKHLLWWILLALALIAAGLYFLLKKKKEKEAIVFVPPIQEALERLKELDEKGLLKQHKIKAYYTELTDIVRTYIEKDIKIPALESTTNELIETIEDINESSSLNISKETIAELQAVLQSADLVKFAKSEPAMAEIKGDRQSIEQIITAAQEAVSAKREAEAREMGEVLKEQAEAVPVATSKTPLLKKYLWLFVIATVMVVGILGFIGYKMIGNPDTTESKVALDESNWVATSYGFPPVGVELPFAMEIASTQLPEGSIALIGDYVEFTNGKIGADFYTSISTVKFLTQLEEYDLDKALEGVKTQLESTGVVFRKTDSDVVFVDDLEGRRLTANVRLETENGTKNFKLTTLVFVDLVGMRQLVVVHKANDKVGEVMSERIVNSLKLK